MWRGLGLVALCVAACGGDAPDETSAGGQAGSGGSGGSAGDGGTAGQGNAPLPIDAPADEWAWRPIDGTLCANGSTAGVAVNLHPDSTELVVVLSGGGACWNDDMCNGAMPASVHLHEDLTETLVAPELPGFARSDPNSTLSTASWVYVPYCTGDLHWGDRRADYPGGAIEHRGAANMHTFLQRLQLTRPATNRVMLFGVSAGGYGATLHWGTAKQLFPGAEVHVMADASPLLVPLAPRWEQLKTEWAPVWPEGCGQCDDDPGFLIDTLASAYPDSRHGLMVYDADAVIAAYFGFADDLPDAIDALQAAHHDPFPNVHYFITTGTDHGVGGDDVTAPDGTTPTSFLAGWYADDPGWHSVDF